MPVHSKQDCSYMPCYKPKCIKGLDCMSGIDLEEIITAIKMLKIEPDESKKVQKGHHSDG